MSVIPAFKEWTQGDHKFKVSLNYKVNFRPIWSTESPSQRKEKEETKKEREREGERDRERE
jgi:hypothetical protein